MRVLAVGSLYPPHHLGGYELLWQSVVGFLRERGHEVRILASDFRRPGGGEEALAGGSRRNRGDAERFTTWGAGVPEWRRRLVCDAMTSGGLLAAVPARGQDKVHGWPIGSLVVGAPGTVSVL